MAGTVNTEGGSLTKQLSNANPDGLIVGQSITDKIGFFGIAPPVTQQAGVSHASLALSVGTGATSTSPFGFTTAGQANALVLLVNSIANALENLGLLKVS